VIKPKAKRTPHTTAKKTAKPKAVRKDPLKEYAEAIKGDGFKTVSVMDPECSSSVDTWIPTGGLATDALLNGKGIACGRITEMYGPPHIGKSTILDMLFHQVQLMGGVGILCDTESARDSNYTVKGLGVDPAKLHMLEFKDPNAIHIESVFNKFVDTVDFWREKYPDTPVVLGLDSLGNLATSAEMEKDIGERTVAAAAKAMRQVCRKLVGRLARSRVALVVVNHQYTNVNTMGGRPAARLTYAGDALRLAATYRLEFFFRGLVKKQDGVVLGREVGVRLDKNRFGPCRDTKMAILNGKGVDNIWTLFDTLSVEGVISKSGSWSTLNLGDVQKKFQGFQGLADAVVENPALFDLMVDAYKKVTANV
jgi:recombination protein RecA